MVSDHQEAGVGSHGWCLRHVFLDETLNFIFNCTLFVAKGKSQLGATLFFVPAPGTDFQAWTKPKRMK